MVNAYIDEKEDACSALAELALNTGYDAYTDVILCLIVFVRRIPHNSSGKKI